MGFAALYTILRIQMRGPACVEPGRRTWMLLIVAKKSYRRRRRQLTKVSPF